MLNEFQMEGNVIFFGVANQSQDRMSSTISRRTLSNTGWLSFRGSGNCHKGRRQCVNVYKARFCLHNPEAGKCQTIHRHSGFIYSNCACRVGRHGTPPSVPRWSGTPDGVEHVPLAETFGDETSTHPGFTWKRAQPPVLRHLNTPAGFP